MATGRGGGMSNTCLNFSGLASEARKSDPTYLGRAFDTAFSSHLMRVWHDEKIDLTHRINLSVYTRLKCFTGSVATSKMGSEREGRCRRRNWPHSMYSTGESRIYEEGYGGSPSLEDGGSSRGNRKSTPLFIMPEPTTVAHQLFWLRH